MLVEHRQKGKLRSSLEAKIGGGVNRVGGSCFPMLETDGVKTGSARCAGNEEKSDEIVNGDGIAARIKKII